MCVLFPSMYYILYCTVSTQFTHTGRGRERGRQSETGERGIERERGRLGEKQVERQAGRERQAGWRGKERGR